MTNLSRRTFLGVVGTSATLLASATKGLAGLPEVTILPKSMDNDTFSKALKELRGIVGDEWVLANEEEIKPYNKKYIPDPESRHYPSGAVAPASVEEVQAILKVANKYHLPLWPISTGKNMGYGSASPATSGQMILDLKRMNKIIDVDPVLCTALVEPGVTYQQLADYIAEHNLPLWLDVPTVGPMVSPVGNTLDRGVGYTPYGEHFMMQCGMEVVLPNGEILRTGMGSVKNSTTWQAFKWGYGPYVDGIFSQSNFGVVTKMGMWLMPAPPVYKPFVVRHNNTEDVSRIVEAMRPFRLSQIIPNGVLMMHAGYQLAMFNKRSDIWDKPEAIPDDVLKKAANKVGLGVWNTYFALYGTEEIVASNEKLVRAAFENIDGEVLTREDMEGNPYFHHHDTLMRGGMSLEEIGILGWRGAGGGGCCFAPVAPAKGEETKAQIELVKAILNKYKLDYTAAFAIGWRELHHIIFILFDKTHPEEHQRAEQCYREMILETGKRGWAAYRTSVSVMDLVASQYGDTNRQFNKTLKDAIDPNGILAPGKSGII